MVNGWFINILSYFIVNYLCMIITVIKHNVIVCVYVLTCRPEPVQWTKDGGELPDQDRMIVEEGGLTFTSLNKTDNGTYRCETSNNLGTEFAEYKLFVYGE